MQIFVELVFGRPHRPVDALKHRVLLAAAPVGPGDRRELEMFALAGASDVRTRAQIREVADRIGGNGFAGDAVDQFDLEVLVVRAKNSSAFGLSQFSRLN